MKYITYIIYATYDIYNVIIICILHIYIYISYKCDIHNSIEFSCKTEEYLVIGTNG